MLVESRSLGRVLRAMTSEYLCSIAATNGQVGGFLHTEVAPILQRNDLPCLSHQWPLAFVVAPAIIPRTSLHRGLVHWMLMVVGMMWQFVVSLAVLRRELGGLHWPTLKKRIRLNLPRDPRTGKPRKVLFLWAVSC
jgi:hypothetical protein